jgi:hypothetical protein
MSFTIRKLRNKRCYSVKSKNRVHSKCTTLKKAKRQVGMLKSLKFRKNKRKMKI